MLVIELDGEIHNQSIEEDVLRDKKLKADGITVLRFENRFVFEHTDFVLEEIKNNFNQNNFKVLLLAGGACLPLKVLFGRQVSRSDEVVSLLKIIILLHHPYFASLNFPLLEGGELY